MVNFRSIVILIALLAGISFVMFSYQQQEKGTALFEEYFDAAPPTGYGLQRGFQVAGGSDLDASMLRQGVLYHQQGKYDLALPALRAYLEGNPTPENYLPQFLAATAALATGEYAEGAIYLEAMPKEQGEAAAAAAWYGALLALRKKKYREATEQLRLIEQYWPAHPFPITALLDNYPVAWKDSVGSR